MDSDQPQRETQIRKAMDELHKGIAMLDEKANFLAERLSPALRSLPPTPEKPTTGEDQAKECDLAEDILSGSRKICAIRERLEDLLERLEL